MMNRLLHAWAWRPSASAGHPNHTIPAHTTDTPWRGQRAVGHTSAMTPGLQPRSRAVGAEMVRRLALMLMAAGLSTLVLLTQRLMRIWVGDDLFLGWATLWCVLLSALLLLSRLVTALAQWAVVTLDTWVWRLARQRAARRQRTHSA